jgi:Ca2+-binding EF-hand superfamily protein
MMSFADITSTAARHRERGRDQQAAFYDSILAGASQTDEIPQFYFAAGRIESEFADLFTSLSASHACDNLLQLYPTREDIDELRRWHSDSACKTMKYQQYKQLRAHARPPLQRLLTAKLFCELSGRPVNSISVDELFRFLEMIAVSVVHFSKLHMCDGFQTGQLDEKALSNYVKEMASMVWSDGEFMDDFVDFAVSRILAELDFLRTGRVSVSVLLRHQLYHEFVLHEFEFGRNSFAPAVVSAARDEFNLLDPRRTGVLQRADLPRMQLSGAFTARACDLLCGTGLLDFRWFVRFKTTWKALGEKWANTALFDVFDVDGDGKVTDADVRFFWKEMTHSVDLIFSEIDHTPVEWVVFETFEKFGADGWCITRDQFVNGGKQTEALVRTLVDVVDVAKKEYDETLKPFGEA